jgi:NAD(P)-dependent dehydrogenase (short-subunit alcohol dehydrogenase family)
VASGFPDPLTAPRRMAGRRAVVTGGASGIGLACVQRLQAEGAAVAVLDQEAEPADATSATFFRCDVRDPAAVDSALGEAAAALGGPPDVLVSAAGIYRVAPLADISVAEWDDVLQVNLRGSFLAGRAFAAALIKDGLPGAVVNVASTAALVADAAEPSAHYSASKAGVVALTRQMAVEWAAHRIRVNAVCPGVIDTPMLRLMDDRAAGMAYLNAAVPLRRLGSAAEVAAVITFLASDDASYLTGCAVPVDGGSTAI